MSADLERQLEGYARDVVAGSQPVDVSGITGEAAQSTDGEAGSGERGVAARTPNPQNTRGRTMGKTENRRWWGVAAAAAAVVLVVGVAVAVATSDDDATTTITDDGQAPGEAEAPDTTASAPPPMSTVEGASTATDAYFDAFLAGDYNAVMAYFPAEATFEDPISGIEDRAGFEAFTAWDIAKGSVRQSVECAESEDTSDLVEGMVRLDCTYEDDTYLAQVVDGPTVPVTMRVTFTDDGIVSYFSIFGAPNYDTVNIPFDEWMAEHHPDRAAETGCCAGQTVEESQARGEARQDFADLWAAWLQENDCTYDEAC